MILNIQGRCVEYKEQLSTELYIVRDTQAGLSYLLKQVSPLPSTRLKTLHKELRLLRELSPHPNILGLVSFKESASDFLMLYEYCRGGTLESHKPADALRALYGLCLGLKHMHSRPIPVIHCNLTPSNVYENEGHYKLAGLEASTAQYANLSDIDVPQLEAEILRLTDERWRAPELMDLNSHSVIDCKVDSWSLGMILYYMTFGMTPFADASEQKIGKYHLPWEVSWKIADLLSMMLKPNPLERADMAGILSKLDEQVIKPDNFTCQVSCFAKLWGSFRSTRSTAGLVSRVYSVEEVFTRETCANKLIEKVWKKPNKVAKFYGEMLKLKRLSLPQVRLKACMLLIFYMQDAPLIAYHQSPGVIEVLRYIEGYCSVRPGHPLKNDLFRRITNAIATFLKEKYYITNANSNLFNGKFYINEANQVNLTTEQCYRVIEVLLNYWSTLIQTHEILAQKAHLELIRRALRKTLMDEQSRLIDLLQVLYGKVQDPASFLSTEYMKHYYRCKALFEIDGQSLQGGLVPSQALPDILITDPILDNVSKVASMSEAPSDSKFNSNDCMNDSVEQMPLSPKRSWSLNADILNDSSISNFEDVQQWDIDVQNIHKIKAIGRGSSSEVWLGLYQKTHVAVKQLNVIDKKYLKEFRRELKLLIKLRHPNLVLLMGAQLQDPLCIVMEFCEGGDLFHLLHKSKDTFVTWEQKLKILQDIAKGMHFLHHNGYMHRDLKSLNLLLAAPLQRCSDAVYVKISDFGLSRAYREEVVMTGNLGTCHWMSPEILAGKEYSFQADVYSYAIVMYEVISREIPYRGLPHEAIRALVLNEEGRPDLSAVPPNCPRALQQLMTMCWRTDPNKRPKFSGIVDILNSIQVPKN